MDPLNDLRGEIGSVGPIDRTMALMEAQEHRESAAAEAERYNRQAEAEAALRNLVARQRIERFTQGHTTEELQRFEAEREQIKQAKIAEHEAALRRLRGEPDPDVPLTQRSAGLFPEQDSVEAARQASSDPLMRKLCLEFDYRQDIARRDRRRFEDARRSLMPAGVRQALNERRWAMDQVDQAAEIFR